MKITFLLLLLGPFIWTSASATERGDLRPPTDIAEASVLGSILYTDMLKQEKDLKKVKYYRLNGETRLAKLRLTRLSYTQTKLRPVVHRYLAILTFLEGSYQKSQEYLSLPELQEIPHFGKICV